MTYDQEIFVPCGSHPVKTQLWQNLNPSQITSKRLLQYKIPSSDTND